MTTSFLRALPACLPTRTDVARAGWIPYHSPFANTETAQVNKAFVKESDGADDGDEELAPAQRLPAGSKNYMTRRGYDALRVELDQLVRFERPKLVETVAWAAGNGDRSENGDYIYGKKRLREIDRRIRFLTKKLDSAVVVKRDEAAHQSVYFGATVEVEDENGQRKRYRIVGPDEVNPAAGTISFKSPLGTALMKRKVGDVVTVRRPAGEVELQICSISYE